MYWNAFLERLATHRAAGGGGGGGDGGGGGGGGGDGGGGGGGAGDSSAAHSSGECCKRRRRRRVGEGGLERAAGVFYVRPSVRYQFKHPQASKRREPLSTRLRA